MFDPSAHGFVWLFGSFSHCCSTLACLMFLVSLPHQWPLWPHAGTPVERVVCSASETAVAVPVCGYCDALHCTAIQRHSTHHDTTRGGTAQLAEMSRVELNLAAAASPMDKLELIHQQNRAAHFLSSAGEMGPQGLHHAQKVYKICTREIESPPARPSGGI